MQARWIGIAAALALAIAGPAAAKTLHFKATLSGAAETPPNTSKGTGQLTATLDTKTKHFTYAVSYKGLTGPAMAAHFHGPADAGASAGVALPVPKTALANPIKGEATLTDAQVSDLEAGKWYFNIHTAANAGGEVRGQLPAEK